MGEFKFRLPADWSLQRRQASSIHTVGIDGIPWPCKVSTQDQILTISRNRHESGKTYIPWTFEAFGELMIATGTLLENPEPYPLLTELARGTLNRLRNQISIWEEGGLKIPANVFGLSTNAAKLLGSSIMEADPVEQDAQARLSIEATAEAIFELSNVFGKQVTQFRKSNENMHPFWIANTISPSRPVGEGIKVDGFELVRMNFTQLQSADATTLEKRVIAGPFLDASVNGMPQSLIDAGNHDARRKIVVESCRSSLKDLSPAVSLLHVVGGLNGMGHRHLSYPQQLDLTTQLLDEVSNANVEIPTMVSFDFPWAERLASAVGGSHPLQIADSLLRQGAQISFLGIEVNLGYFPGGSAMRDPLQWIDMLDTWTQLGLPLIVLLRAPTWSIAGDDVISGNATGNAVDTAPSPAKHINAFEGTADLYRIRYLKTILQMLVARPTVHGIIWSQWHDNDDERYPHGGLADQSDRLKSVYEVLTALDR